MTRADAGWIYGSYETPPPAPVEGTGSPGASGGRPGTMTRLRARRDR